MLRYNKIMDSKQSKTGRRAFMPGLQSWVQQLSDAQQSNAALPDLTDATMVDNNNTSSQRRKKTTKPKVSASAAAASSSADQDEDMMSAADYAEIEVSVREVLHDVRDVFTEDDKEIEDWLDELQTMRLIRQTEEEAADDLVCHIPDFKQQELLDKMKRLPVAAVRIQLFGNGVTDEQLIQMTKERALELPLLTSDHENLLLRESGKSWCSTTQKHVLFPPCVHGEQCKAYTIPLQVSQLHPDAASSSAADSKLDSVKPLILTQILYPHEYDALTRSGSIHVEPRPCVLCMRYALYDFVLCLRNNRRDSSNSDHVVEPESIGLHQLYRSLVDEPGGYVRDQMMMPEAQSWEGFVDPFVVYRYSRLRAVYDTVSSCWFVDQRALLYRMPEVASVRVGETVAHFRKRGIAAMHAQVYAHFRANSRSSTWLLDMYGVSELREQLHLAMSRDDSAFTVAQVRAIKHKYKTCYNSDSAPLRLAVFLRMDLWIAYSVGVDAQRVLFYPSTVRDSFPYLQQASLFHSSRTRVDAVVHLLNKCLPQRCQGRKSPAIFSGFFSKLLRLSDRLESEPTKADRDEYADKSVVVHWIVTALLANWTRFTPHHVLSPSTRRLLLQTAAKRYRVLLRFLRDFPLVAVAALQEFVAHALVDDDVMCERIRGVLDVTKFGKACLQLGDKCRSVLNTVLKPALECSDEDKNKRVQLQRVVVDKLQAGVASRFTEFAYYRERKSAWQMLISKQKILMALMAHAERAHLHLEQVNRVLKLKRKDSAIGATDMLPLDDIISPIASEIIRHALYSSAKEECVSHGRPDVPLRFVKLAVCLATCEGMRGLGHFIACAEETAKNKLGDRRGENLLLQLVRRYPRVALVLIWINRVYAFYANGSSFPLPRHHRNAQARALARTRPSAGNRIHLSLKQIVLIRCRSCKMVCTLVRRLRKLYKHSYDKGYRNLHIDLTTMRRVCKNYQNPDLPCCAVVEPVRAMLLGRLFRWEQTVYTLCGARGCGAAMEWDARQCAYQGGAYYCHSCTQELMTRRVHEHVDEVSDYATKDCLYCGRSLYTQSPSAVAFGPYEQFLCARHLDNGAIKAFFAQTRWRYTTNRNLFDNALQQTKIMIKQARRQRMKAQNDRAIALSKQKTASRSKR